MKLFQNCFKSSSNDETKFSFLKERFYLYHTLHKSSSYALDYESLEICNESVKGIIVSPNQPKLQFKLQVISNISFNLLIDEAKQSNRFQIKRGDSILENVSLSKIDVKVSDDHSNILIESTELTNHSCVINCHPFQVILLKNNKEILSINKDNSLLFENRMAYSTKLVRRMRRHSFTWANTFNVNDIDASSVGVDVLFKEFSHAYGLPEHADGFQLKHSKALKAKTKSRQTYSLYNADVFAYQLSGGSGLYGSVPLIWAANSSCTAGVFWHNASDTKVDLNYHHVKGAPQIGTHWCSERGVIDMFLFASDSPSEALSCYLKLTGSPPLPPLYSLGYHQCRWNYDDEKDLLFVHENLRKSKIPCDCLWLDIEYTNGKRYFTWDFEKFPNPDLLVQNLRQDKRRLVTIIDPHIKIDNEWSFYREAKELNYFVKTSNGTDDFVGECWPGKSSWLDYSNPDVQNWWSNQFLTYTQNVLIWNDMNEPSVFNNDEKTLPKNCLHHDKWTHGDLHNLYGFQQHRATWEGLLRASAARESDDKIERPFVLTRSFFAGSQRCCAVWTGDNVSEWSHLKASVYMLLSLSVCGFSLVGADVGGFFGDPDPELLTRWYQAGALQPFFRAHANRGTKRREPYLLPENELDIVRSSISLRYSLLPYLYTASESFSRTAVPVMAPLWFHFPHDSVTYDIEDSYMLGQSFLVKPVCTPQASEIEVYFPSDSSALNWRHFGSWKLFPGGRKDILSVDLATIPLFVKCGSIIPRWFNHECDSSIDYQSCPHSLFVILDSDGCARGEVYVDDYLFVNSSRSAIVHFICEKFSLKIDQIAGDPCTQELNGIERLVFIGCANVRCLLIDFNGEQRRVSPTNPITSTTDIEFHFELKELLPFGKSWTAKLSFDE